MMQRLIFEYSPWLIPLCLVVGIIYAFILYRMRNSWGASMNRILFGLRTLLVSCLAFLLMGPILKLTFNTLEKPAIVLLADNSASVGKSMNEAQKENFTKQLEESVSSLSSEGYEVAIKNLEGLPIDEWKFNETTSNIAGAIRQVSAEFEGKNLAKIILISDGIYNAGISPLYTSSRIPLYTVGLGDTVQRTDIILKNLLYNKVAYQGNRFLLRAEIVVQDMPNEDITVEVRQGGKELMRQTRKIENKTLLTFDFQLEAKEKGLQRFEVFVHSLKGESNQGNNRATAFVEVVDGKKKILMIAPAPHPDIKAIRTVVEKNSNYEFILHIPGITSTDPALLRPGSAELVIFQEAFDQEDRTAALFSTFAKSSTSLFLMLGDRTNLRKLSAGGVPVTFESIGQRDEVTPVLNSEYLNFNFLENTSGAISKYPPVEVPFGKFSYPGNASMLLQQRIGNVASDRPLLMSWEDANRKMAVLMGSNIWRWRLSEFAVSESTEFFDDVFSKLVQYLSTPENKSKFRCFPLQNEFAELEPVILESQVYNDLFEPVYGNAIRIELRNEQGKISTFNYVTSPGGTRYRLGGLEEGVYFFKATTSLDGNTQEANGQFVVKKQNREMQDLTADHNLLRNLAANTGGKFYKLNEWNKLIEEIKKDPDPGLLHSEDSFNPLINLKWIFFWLLFIISMEWFLRKYFGSY